MRLFLLILRFVLLLGVVSSFVWAFWGQAGDIGSSIEIKDGVSHASAGTNPRAVAMGLLMLLIYIVVLAARVRAHPFRTAPADREICIKSLQQAGGVEKLWHCIVHSSSQLGHGDHQAGPLAG